MSWQCMKCGECCTRPKSIGMHVQELAEMTAQAPHIEVTWEPARHKDGSPKDGFVYLKAAPCPFYKYGKCIVYDERPYNCRRYMCFRQPGEELEDADIPSKVYENRGYENQWNKNEKKAMKWAREHGWK